MGVFEARHGAWRHSWVISAIFGPFAIAFALQRRHQTAPDAAVLTPSRPRRGSVDVLIGLDGSDNSMTAASFALWLLGPRIRRVTLAAVLDLDTAAPHDDMLYPESWPEERDAYAYLEQAAESLQQTFSVLPGSVILAGQPAEALEKHAIEQGYEVIVAGCRGKGLSKRLLGSCASQLAGKTKVPVLLIPAEPAVSMPSSGSAPAEATARP